MDRFIYRFKGQIHNLSKDERRPFNNCESMHCVCLNSPTVFTLKSGEIIEGVPVNIEYIYPEDGADAPLQSVFKIMQGEGEELIMIDFTQIESHTPQDFNQRLHT